MTEEPAIPLRVLIVEDRPDDAELMLDQLRESGFDPEWKLVETASDYVENLDDDIDIVLSDYSLPQFDGQRAIQLLKASGLHIPLIIVTGSISEEVAVECMRKGAVDYLLKDRLARLGRAVFHALEEEEAHEAKRKAEGLLRERVKELTCLHGINRGMQESPARETICRQIIQYLVPAMQFPDMAVPVIELDGMRYTPDRYTEGLSHGLHADVRAGEDVFGRLSVYYTGDKPFLLPEEQNLVDTIGRDLGLWIERVQAKEKLQRALGATVETLGQMAEERDPYTAGHQRRVSQLACAIAAEMKLPEEQAEGIRVVGLLHDIGKMSIPAEILAKAKKLSETEFSLIISHCQVAYDLLKKIDFPWPVADIVLQHHERADGSGYPNALRGDAILPEARIIGVADVVEAMASHRPYRPALGVETALEEIREHRGTRYDSTAVDACCRVFEGGFVFSEDAA